jgi:hypothetical protein
MNKKVLLLKVDENNEPIDMNHQRLQLPENRIVWAEGVPNPHDDPKAFAAHLEAWHRKHNPQLFVGDE